MNWNNQRSCYVEKGVKKAYVDGTGNTAEINFILIAMLNYAGIGANPVLVSTVDHGIPLPLAEPFLITSLLLQRLMENEFY